MISSAELSMLRAATQTLRLPGLDSAVGDPNSLSQLKSWTTLPTDSNAPVAYDAVNNRVIVRVAGTVVDGYDFRGVTVAVSADNVTIKNSSFDAKVGYYAIHQYPGHSGMTV